MRRFVREALLPVARLTAAKWQADDCATMGTSLAYYALFSLFPLLLVLLSILGFVAGPGSDARAQILALARESLPPSAFGTVQESLASLTESRGEGGLVGFLTLLLGASGFFGALDKSFDTIWRAEARAAPDGLLAKVRQAAAQRALSFALVLGCVLLVLLSTLAGFAVELLAGLARGLTAGLPVRLDDVWLIAAAQIGVSYVALAAVLTLLYRALPATKVRVSDVWPGALLAALLLLALQRLVVGGVVNIGSSYSSYGVIGGAMLLLLWIYLASLVLLVGAELCYAYATLLGSRRAAPEEQSADPSPEPAPPEEPAGREAAARAAAAGVVVGALGAASLLAAGAVMAAAGLARAIRRRAG